MKKITIILLALFFKVFAFSQESKIEFSNLKLNEKELDRYKLIEINDNLAFMICKSKIVEISDKIKVSEIDPKIYSNTISGSQFDYILDTFNLRFYSVQSVFVSSFKTKICLNYWDFKNSNLSKTIEYKTNKSWRTNYCFSVYNGKLIFFVDSEDEILIYEVDFLTENFNLISTIEKGGKDIVLYNINGKVFQIQTININNKQELVLSSYNQKDIKFSEFGRISINLNKSILRENDKILAERKIEINELNNDQFVVYFSQLTEKAKDKSALANKYREVYIYECNLLDEEVTEKIIQDKNFYSMQNTGLEVIFQKDKIVYLESSLVSYLRDNEQVICRLLYVFDDENNLIELKLVDDQSDMVLFLEESIDVSIRKELGDKEVTFSKYYPHFDSRSVYNYNNELVSYRFKIQGSKDGYSGYYYVYKNQLK